MIDVKLLIGDNDTKARWYSLVAVPRIGETVHINKEFELRVTKVRWINAADYVEVTVFGDKP